MPPEDRIALTGSVLTNDELPPRLRAAAIIVLLYAQPLSRIVRLTIDDVTHGSDQVLRCKVDTDGTWLGLVAFAIPTGNRMGRVETRR
ncbi:hypothetical protein ACW9HH_32670 [Nocardia gipuzkoensis]